MNSESEIAETASRAKLLLFDKGGNPKGHEHHLALITLHTVLRPSSAIVSHPPPGCYVEFEWKGSSFVYDVGIAELFLHEANAGSVTADQVLCNAAAVMLSATKGIFDSRLRKYACGRLSGDIRLSVKRARGRRAADNSLRDTVIAGWLIPPLLALGFYATRNDATEAECACSITSSALERVGISLSERRIAEIWGRVSRLFPPDVANK